VIIRSRTLERRPAGDDPATRAARVYRDLLDGVVITGALVPAAVLATVLLGSRAVPLVVASTTALAWLAAGASIARSVCRERTTAMLARDGWSDAPHVRREYARLTSRSHRLQLARSFERLLWEAQNFDRIWLPSRPPPATRRLCELAGEIETIVLALRDETPGRVESIAICDRLLAGGYDALVYRGDVRALRELLARIRCGLLMTPDR
jgi:hypothetical protein